MLADSPFREMSLRASPIERCQSSIKTPVHNDPTELRKLTEIGVGDVLRTEPS